MAAEELLTAAAGSASKGAIDSVVAAADASRKDRIWREHQDILFQQQMESQRRSIPNLVASYRAAGLNPALAAGGSAMNVGSAAPAGGSDPSAGEMNPEFGKASDERNVLKKQLEIGDSQIAKNMAEAGKASEEQRGFKQQNDLFEERANLTNEFAGSYIQYLASGARAAGDDSRADALDMLLSVWNDAAKEGARYGVGLLQAVDSLNASMVADSDKYARLMDNVLKNTITQATLSERKVIDAIVNAPLVQRASLYTQIAETNKHIALMDEQIKTQASMTAHTEADTKRLAAEEQRIKADIVKIGREAASILYSDPQQMMEEEEYFALGTYLLGRGLDLAAGAGAAYLGGRGFAAGTNAARGAAAPAAPAPRGVRRSPNELLTGEIHYMNGQAYFYNGHNWTPVKSYKR